MGNWDNAFIKSILFVGFGSIFYLLIMAVVNSYEPHEAALVIALYGSGYLVVSFVGWVVIGLPSHYLIAKYTNAGYLNYVVVILVLVLIFGFFTNVGSALFVGAFATGQAMIFRYYVYK